MINMNIVCGSEEQETLRTYGIIFLIFLNMIPLMAAIYMTIKKKTKYEMKTLQKIGFLYIDYDE